MLNLVSEAPINCVHFLAFSYAILASGKFSARPPASGGWRQNGQAVNKLVLCLSRKSCIKFILQNG